MASDSISLIVCMADGTIKAAISSPPNVTVGLVLQSAQQRWNLPSGSNYGARLVRTGEQLDNSIALGLAGIEPKDVLKIYPILGAGYVSSTKQIIKDILDAKNIGNSSLDLVYGIFLYTDEDVKLAKYIKENLASFDKLTGNWSKIYIFEKPEPNIESLKKYWTLILHAQIYKIFPWLTNKPFDKSEIYETARQLNILFDQLPCLVFLPPGKKISSQEKLIVSIKKVSTQYFITVFSTLENIVNQIHVKNKYEELKIKFSDIIKYLENYSEKVVKKTTIRYKINDTKVFVNSEIRRLKMINENNPKIQIGDSANIASVTGLGEIDKAIQNQYNYAPQQKQNLGEVAA